jgi:hypothetical protein
MPVPVLTVAALLARAVTSVLTHPTTWILFLGWFAVSQFDFGIAANQLQQSIAELWWLIVLILLTAICNTAIKAHFQCQASWRSIAMALLYTQHEVDLEDRRHGDGGIDPRPCCPAGPREPRIREIATGDIDQDVVAYGCTADVAGHVALGARREDIEHP